MLAEVGRAEPPRTRSVAGSVKPVTFSENVTVNWICGSDVGSAWPAAGVMATVGGTLSKLITASAEAVFGLRARSTKAPASSLAATVPVPYIPETATRNCLGFVMSGHVTTAVAGFAVPERPISFPTMSSGAVETVSLTSRVK